MDEKQKADFRKIMNEASKTATTIEAILKGADASALAKTSVRMVALGGLVWSMTLAIGIGLDAEAIKGIAELIDDLRKELLAESQQKIAAALVSGDHKKMQESIEELVGKLGVDVDVLMISPDPNSVKVDEKTAAAVDAAIAEALRKTEN
jgi:hypothetical protein